MSTKPGRPEGISDSAYQELLWEWWEEGAERRSRDFRVAMENMGLRIDGQDNRMNLSDERQTRLENEVSGVKSTLRWILGGVAAVGLMMMATLATGLVNLIIRMGTTSVPPG